MAGLDGDARCDFDFAVGEGRGLHVVGAGGLDAAFAHEFAAAAEGDFAFGLVVLVGVDEEFAVAAQGDVARAVGVVERVLVVVVDLVGEVGAAVEGIDAPVAARVAVVVFGVAADDAAVGDVAEAGAAVHVGADAGGVLDADAVTAGAHVAVGAEVGEGAVVVVACCRRFFRGRVGFVVVGDGFVVADDEARAFFRDGLAALGAAVDGAGAGFDVALDDAFVVDASQRGERGVAGRLVNGDAVAAGACVDAEVAGAVARFKVGVAADAAVVVDFAEAGFDARDLCVEGVAVEADAVAAAVCFAAAHHVRRVVAAVVAGDLADLSADMAVVIDVVQRNAGGVFGKAAGAGKERDAVAAAFARGVGVGAAFEGGLVAHVAAVVQAAEVDVVLFFLGVGVFVRGFDVVRHRDAVTAGDEADVVELRGVAVFVERALELLRACGDVAADAAAVMHAGDRRFQVFAVHVAFVGVFR